MFDLLYSLIEKLPELLQTFLFLVFLGGGAVLLIKGADYFVDGASNLAHKLKIPAVVIGMTIVSFGTSAPEASVSISAALNGNADIAIGNIVGSNICNILLVLGLSALFVPIVVKKPSVFIDLIIMVFASIILLIMFLFFPLSGSNGLIRIEGVILFISIILFVIYNVVKALKHKTTDDEVKVNKNCKLWLTILILIGGLIGVIIGGDFVTYGASNLAQTIGFDDAIVGLTVVAICTSLPELVTTFVAAKKKENDIALGNVVGSNIFNILFILGITSIIKPINIDSSLLFDIIFVIIVSVAVLLFYLFNKKITKKYGIIMISTYFLYLTYLVIAEIGVF